MMWEQFLASWRTGGFWRMAQLHGVCLVDQHMLSDKKYVSSCSCLGNRDPLRWPRNTLYRQKLALTSPACGGRSVGIVRSQTKATDLMFLCTWQLYTLSYLLGNSECGKAVSNNKNVICRQKIFKYGYLWVRRHSKSANCFLPLIIHADRTLSTYLLSMLRNSIPQASRSSQISWTYFSAMWRWHFSRFSWEFTLTKI
jgi:hypothetical protein